jgi:hypothetical protein
MTIPNTRAFRSSRRPKCIAWDISDDIVCTERLLVALQRSLVHLLGLGQLALVGVEAPQVVDRVKR